ncbi:hypothetical protein CAOG_07987 [Capsaspora owczarzaki ATCC 30864]|uniref:Uncharacterized protein n=1 Tax=Capsaspora owczarzaki (strain ATCC 30864) TaxID=595528 RepID=A0A0D2WYD8_CAPO3|nr:hypothetical protein CAOG_07987 [Capsaspora owczarzaki ATCC 30864]KJE97918.1 hypothetical protein CAOG_007987 [Capsaspora owczarzaki ATCC 30864]|eukprot:XP_004342588.1 hypothetical protein CAOG_07987 [Capsaspora owczarzaki ATCC 30864]
MTVQDTFLSAGAQHLRVRLPAAVDFVNEALVQLGFAETTVAAQGSGGPVAVTVTERGVALHIGACAGSMQKIIAILTLLYHLIHPAAAAHKEDTARKLTTETFTQRIFLIDELEALLYENVTAKLYEFLVSTCAQHDIQLIVATNSRAIIEPRLNTRREVLFLTPDGKAVELTDELPKDEENQQSLFPILNALSQVKDSKPLLVVEGANDQAFYSKYTTLGQHFQFLTTSGAVNKQNLSNILTQARLKHVFLRDSDMYAASPDLPAAQARIARSVGAPVVYTLLPCIESYLILHRLLKSVDVDALRVRTIRALPQCKWYFVSTFRDFGKESKQKPPPTAAHHCEPEGTMQRSADRLATMTNDELRKLPKADLKLLCGRCKEPIFADESKREDRASAASNPPTPDGFDAFGSLFGASTAEVFQPVLPSDSASDEPARDPASDLASSENGEAVAMLNRMLADSENDPDVLWDTLIAQLTADATPSSSSSSSSSSFEHSKRVSFWTTYVKMVRGHDLMPNAAAVMRGLERRHLHPDVKALLNETEQAVLASLH